MLTQQKDFLDKFLRPALELENETGFSAVFCLAQIVQEAGWDIKAPGNNLFGIKANSAWQGQKVLVTTTEYHPNNQHLYPVIISIKKEDNGMYHYLVKDYFRAYANYKDSMADHIKFFEVNGLYKEALKVKGDPNAFAEAVFKAGYATAPTYLTSLKSLISTIQKISKEYAAL